MAKETVTRLVDDLDGTEAIETITFDGRSIDLNARNVKRIHKLLDEGERARARVEADRKASLAEFLEASRPAVVVEKVRRSRHRVLAPGGRLARTESVAIRTWAASKGYKVAPRGRVAKVIVDEYRAEHGRRA